MGWSERERGLNQQNEQMFTALVQANQDKQNSLIGAATALHELEQRVQHTQIAGMVASSNAESELRASAAEVAREQAQVRATFIHAEAELGSAKAKEESLLRQA